MTSLAIAHVEQGQRQVLVNILQPASIDSFYVAEDVIDGGIFVIYRQNLDMLNEESVPARFQRKAFDRVAHNIGAALKAFPSVIAVQSNLSATTLARCIQEALTAKRRYDYPHPAIDETLWTKFNERLGTAMKDAHTVMIGDKETLRKGITSVVGDILSAPEFEVTRDGIMSIAALLHTHALKPVPKFYIRDISATQMQDVESVYDVAFAQDSNDPSKYYIV